MLLERRNANARIQEERNSWKAEAGMREKEEKEDIHDEDEEDGRMTAGVGKECLHCRILHEEVSELKLELEEAERRIGRLPVKLFKRKRSEGPEDGKNSLIRPSHLNPIWPSPLRHQAKKRKREGGEGKDGGEGEGERKDGEGGDESENRDMSMSGESEVVNEEGKDTQCENEGLVHASGSEIDNAPPGVKEEVAKERFLNVRLGSEHVSLQDVDSVTNDDEEWVEADDEEPLLDSVEEQDKNRVMEEIQSLYDKKKEGGGEKQVKGSVQENEKKKAGKRKKKERGEEKKSPSQTQQSSVAKKKRRSLSGTSRVEEERAIGTTMDQKKKNTKKKKKTNLDVEVKEESKTATRDSQLEKKGGMAKKEMETISLDDFVSPSSLAVPSSSWLSSLSPPFSAHSERKTRREGSERAIIDDVIDLTLDSEGSDESADNSALLI